MLGEFASKSTNQFAHAQLLFTANSPTISLSGNP